MLQALGSVYVNKSRAWLSSNNIDWRSGWGIGGWVQNAKGQYQVFSESISTLNAAIELKKAFDALANADKDEVTLDERKALEDDAADKVILQMSTLVSTDESVGPQSHFQRNVPRNSVSSS